MCPCAFEARRKLGTRCEIKNLNSFRNIERAITYETGRQAEICWTVAARYARRRCCSMPTRAAPRRCAAKKKATTIAIFPIPILAIAYYGRPHRGLREALPELPDAMAERFKQQFGVSEQDAALLTQERGFAVYFETVAASVGGQVNGKMVANWLTGDFLAEANNRHWDLSNPPVTATHMAELLTLLGNSTISGKIAKVVFQEMAERPDSPKAIVQRKNLVQVSDEGAITALVEKILNANPAQVGEYLGGKDKMIGFFVGQIMKESQGKMNPGLVNSILLKRLDTRR